MTNLQAALLTRWTNDKDKATEDEQIKQDAALAKQLSEEEQQAAAAAARTRPTGWAPQGTAPRPADPAAVEEGRPVSSSGTPWNENWSCEEDGLFGCGMDFCTSCIVIWCGWLTSAQLYERVKGPKGVFYWIIAIFFTLWFIELILTSVHASVAKAYAGIAHRIDYPDGSYSITRRTYLEPTVWSGLASGCHFVFMLVCVLLVMLVRGALRRRDGLAAKQCCGLEDACYSSFCFPCTSCLLLRRVGLRDYTYWFLSPDGGIEALAESYEGRPILGGSGYYHSP